MVSPATAWALLAASALVGLTAVGLIQVVRALPLVRDWVLRGTKPWACDLCMSWWSCLLLGATAAALSDWQWSLTVLPAVGISVWLTGRIQSPRLEAAPMPELEER